MAKKINQNCNNDSKEGKKFPNSAKSMQGSRKGNKDYTSKKYDGNVKTGRNPVDWYISNDQLAKDVASLPYAVLTGRTLPIHQAYTTDAIGHPSFPGVCKLSFVTSVGRSVDGTSAINTASRSIYAWVRHQNSGHSNYEAPDLMIYIMAMMEVYAAYFEAVRIYDLAMTYKLVNRYMPEAVLKALGVNAENISANLAQYRAGLNLFAAKVSSLAVPNNFTTFQRHAMMLSNIFMDSDTDRGQYYVFARSHYRVYDPQTASTGGYLKTYAYADKAPNAGGLTYDVILQILNDMLDPILSDEDMNIMSGDILKAYELANLYVIPGVDENRTISGVFDETVLAQIENAICQNFDDLDFTGLDTPVKTVINQLDITQKNGYIYHAPCIGGPGITGNPAQAIDSYYSQACLSSYVLNSHVKDPDYKFNIEATRLQNVLMKDTQTDGQYNIICGSEILTSINYFYWNVDADATEGAMTLRKTPYGASIIYLSDGKTIDPQYLFDTLTAASTFDWHPFIYIVNSWTNGSATAGNTNRLEVPFGDAKVYSVNTLETIKSIHECVLLSQFRTKLLS